MNRRVIIGIDPDVEQSGVARVDKEARKAWADRLPFPLLIDYLHGVQAECKRTGAILQVYIESTRSITHNWHLKPSDSKAVAAAKGRNIGAMQEVGRLVAEMCEHCGIDATEIPPFKKCWKGKDGKITHDELSAFVPGLPSRTNQEERDAMLLAWNHAGFPIRIPIKR